MIKAIIFDLDGTVADTVGAITEALNLTLSQLNYPLKTEQDVLSIINFGVREFAELALPKEVAVYPEKVEQAMRLYAENYEKTYIHTDKTYDKIPEMLERLKKDFRLGMLSNKQDEFVSALERRLFRKGLFEIAHGVRPGLPPKPACDVPLQFARFFGVEPYECAFVGDSFIDVETALNSNMLPVNVSWGYCDEQTLRQKGSYFIAHTPDDLVRFFCQ